MDSANIALHRAISLSCHIKNICAQTLIHCQAGAMAKKVCGTAYLLPEARYVASFAMKMAIFAEMAVQQQRLEVCIVLECDQLLLVSNIELHCLTITNIDSMQLPRKRSCFLFRQRGRRCNSPVTSPCQEPQCFPGNGHTFSGGNAPWLLAVAISRHSVWMHTDSCFSTDLSCSSSFCLDDVKKPLQGLLVWGHPC